MFLAHSEQSKRCQCSPHAAELFATGAAKISACAVLPNGFTTRFGDSNHGSTAQGTAVLSEPGNGPCPSMSENRTLLGSHAWRECHGEDGKSSLPHTDPKTHGNANIQAIMCTARCRPSRQRQGNTSCHVR